VRPIAAGKERVARDEQFERGEVQADRALGVARRAKHLRGIAFEPTTLTVCRALVGIAPLSGGAMSIHAAFSPIVFKSERSFSVEEDRCAGEAFELERTTAWSMWPVRVKESA